jgi:hypothetical protein
VFQKERSIFWEVIVLASLSKNVCMNMCPILNGKCKTQKLLIRKRFYEYVLFLTPVFTVQVTELVHHHQQSQQPTDASHRFTWFRQWRSRVGGKNTTGRPSQTAIQSNGSILETVLNRSHVHIKILPRMTNTMTSQNIDLPSWDTLYILLLYNCAFVGYNKKFKN